MLTIIRLFLSSSPAAIAGFVILVAFTAIECQSRRTFAHVGKEVFKNEPTIADLNAASAIAMVGVEIWIKASQLHRGPTGVGECLFAVDGSAVSKPCFYAWLEGHTDLLDGGIG